MKDFIQLVFEMIQVPPIAQMACNKIHTIPYLVQDKKQCSPGLEVSNTHTVNPNG